MAECELCGRPVPDEPMKKATWEWFTGYFDRTMHFCPSCKTRNPHLVRRLLNESRITPEDGARKKSATGAIDAAMSASKEPK